MTRCLDVCGVSGGAALGIRAAMVLRFGLVTNRMSEPRARGFVRSVYDARASGLSSAPRGATGALPRKARARSHCELYFRLASSPEPFAENPGSMLTTPKRRSVTSVRAAIIQMKLMECPGAATFG
jgi:hypothetical protein